MVHAWAFYRDVGTGLEDSRHIWERADFQKMLIEMVQWSMGLIPGDAAPRSAPKN